MNNRAAYWNRLERDFGRVLGMTPRPVDPANEPEEGLPDVTDCTGVSIGNSDIEDSSTWDPPQGEPERAPLPGHEHQLDPDSHVSFERRVAAMCEAQIARISAQMRVDGLCRAAQAVRA